MGDGSGEGTTGEGLNRRGFLKLGAAGLAASAAGELRAPSVGRGYTPQQIVPAGEPPPIGDLVDPTDVPYETWLEPMIWRPADWPGDALQLNVIQHQNPGPSPSPGSPFPTLFSYGGVSPAPTIRARGDETVAVTVRNMLDTDHQMTPVGSYPDPVDIPPSVNEQVCAVAARAAGEEVDPDDPGGCNAFLLPEARAEVLSGTLVPGWAIVGHANGQRTAHVTNLHTHGLHVPPNHNPDGSLSDNVLLRIVPKGDWEARLASGDPELTVLRNHERLGKADFRFLLGEARHGAPEGAPSQPHPPGTHWYHPHAHGSTHDQVASGMAGFFIVEGDVDDAINLALTGVERPHPEERSGPFDYRERLILIQRVFLASIDMDAGPRRRQLRFPDPIAVNGVRPASVFFMRPGAVERWRTLNGSVDGTGFKRFMVLEGQYVHERGQLWRVVEDEAPRGDGPGSGAGGGGGNAATAGSGAGGGGGQGAQDEPARKLIPVTRQEVEDAKLPLHLLAMDGITLVTVENGVPRHTVKDLSQQNAGTVHPLAQGPRPGEDPRAAFLRNIEDCFRDGDSIRRCFARPNEVYMGNANRADVFFKAPLDSAGKVFTLFAQEVNVHTDHVQQRMQIAVREGEVGLRRPPMDVVVAYIHVRGEAVEGGDFDVTSLRDALPPVPPFLYPVEDEELRIGTEEAAARGVSAGDSRTRVLSYSGWGGADWSLIRVPESFAEAHPELENLVWGRHEGSIILLPNYTRTMGINAKFDLAVNPDPGPPTKFAPDDPDRPKVLLGTAEEWVLYNCSQTLWGHSDTERFPQPGQWYEHFEAFPISRGEGQARYARDPEFQIVSKGSDHPFHIHINPAWVTRIDVPDENGVLHNILEEPRWMDTFPIPRNGGRVVFRSRFLDFTGRWVHHCHILQHEDNGMMQVIECTDEPRRADYNPRRAPASHDMASAEVDRIYPRPTLEQMYQQNVRFVDPSPIGSQEYPGFEVPTPRLEPEP